MSESLAAKLRRELLGHRTLADLARACDVSYVTIHSMLRRNIIPQPDIGEPSRRRFYSEKVFDEAKKIIQMPRLTVRMLAKQVGLELRRMRYLIDNGVVPKPDVKFGQIAYYSPSLFQKLCKTIKKCL